MNLLHLVVRQWRQRPARTAFSMFSVAIAVAAVLGTALAQSSVRAGNRGLARLVDERPAFEIVSATGGRIVLADVPSLEGIAGLADHFPLISRASLCRLHGRRLRSILVGLPVDQPGLWAAVPIVEGQPCRKPGEALMTAEVARGFGAKVGDRVTLVTRRGPKAVTIVGLVSAKSLGDLAPGATLAISLDMAQQVFDLAGQADRVRVIASSHDERASAQDAVQARLPEGMALQSPSGQIQLADTVLRSTELALRFSGALSLAMAAFIILNTLRMNFGERRRDMALLRVLGATRGQLVALHVAEGACMGMVGSLLGVVLGIFVGRGLSEVMQRLMGAEIEAPTLSYLALAICLVLGPALAALAAVVPALQSRKVTAQESLGGVEPRRRERSPLWAVVTGSLTIVLAMALMQRVVTGHLPPAAAIPVGLMMLLSFIVVLPVVMAPAARFSAWLLAPLLRMEGELAVDQLLERSVRTGLTAGVLVVAINTGLGLGNAILNNVSEVRQWHRRWIAADVSLMDPSVTEASAGAVALDRAELGARIAARPDVERVIEMRFLAARIDGSPACCIVRDFPTGAELPWTVSRGDEGQTPRKLREGEIAVASLLAKKIHLKLGDVVRVEVAGRAFSLRIAALVNDYTLGGLVAYLDHEAAKTMIELGPATIYLAQARPGQPLGPFFDELKALGSESGLVVQSFTELRAQFETLVNGVAGALWALLAVGFVVGGVAVANTLTMNVLEQTRELGLLRIVGMTRRQVRKLVFCQSLLLGVVGTLMGIVAGVTTAVIIHLCQEPLMGYALPFSFSGVLLAANAGGCLLVAILAAWSPAERAARLDVLAAIAYE